MNRWYLLMNRWYLLMVNPIRRHISLIIFIISVIVFALTAAFGQVPDPKCTPYQELMMSLYPPGSVFQPEEVISQLDTESGCDKDAKSKYAFGLAQFTKQTANQIYPEVGCKPDDYDNEICAVKANKLYMERLYSQYEGISESPKLFAWSAYNGGAGRLRSEIRRCRLRPNCNPRKWDGHVSRICLRAKWACRENRDYVRRINAKIPVYRRAYASD